ncbi:unnamed protein product [Camellia sinensis]
MLKDPNCELSIMNYISRDCYDQFGERLPSSHSAWFSIKKFSISNSKDTFTAIGCDTSGSVQITNKHGSVVVASGCQSKCSNIDSVPNDGSCPGIGCCQTSIPKGFGMIKIGVTDFNPCSYAFVIEEREFNFSTTYLKNFKENMVPLVSDWGIGDGETCEEAKRNTRRCWWVYLQVLVRLQREPHLSNGCQDYDCVSSLVEQLILELGLERST